MSRITVNAVIGQDRAVPIHELPYTCSLTTEMLPYYFNWSNKSSL